MSSRLSVRNNQSVPTQDSQAKQRLQGPRRSVAQAEKKRAQDRDSQRSVRTHTKKQIADLEAKIQELSTPTPVADLLRRNASLRTQIDDVLATLRSISRATPISAPQTQDGLPAAACNLEHGHHLGGKYLDRDMGQNELGTYQIDMAQEGGEWNHIAQMVNSIGGPVDHETQASEDAGSAEMGLCEYDRQGYVDAGNTESEGIDQDILATSPAAKNIIRGWGDYDMDLFSFEDYHSMLCFDVGNNDHLQLDLVHGEDPSHAFQPNPDTSDLVSKSFSAESTMCAAVPTWLDTSQTPTEPVPELHLPNADLGAGVDDPWTFHGSGLGTPPIESHGSFDMQRIQPSGQPLAGSTRPSMIASTSMSLPPVCPPTNDWDAQLTAFVTLHRSLPYHGLEPEASSLIEPEVQMLLQPDLRTSSADPITSFLAGPVNRWAFDVPTRLGMFWLQYVLLKWLIAPTINHYEQLPKWYVPSYSQYECPHPIYVDTIVWPKLRDRLTRGFASYNFDIFVSYFCTTIKLDWSKSIEDTCLVDSDGKSVLSPDFKRHVCSIQNWSLGLPFQRAFPDLAKEVLINA